jgi:hypothetical protein
MPGPLIAVYALLSIGGIVAVVLTVKALRRIARSHERSVALLEELVQQQNREPPDSGTHPPDTTGSSAP